MKEIFNFKEFLEKVSVKSFIDINKQFSILRKDFENISEILKLFVSFCSNFKVEIFEKFLKYENLEY